MSTYITSFLDVKNRIKKACEQAGRSERSITLIAVVKQASPEVIYDLMENQVQSHFGENRVQHAQARWSDTLLLQKNIFLHMIGHVQSNKLPSALRLFRAIHTLDSLSLVAALAQAQDKGTKLPMLFVQVNIGYEAQKFGVFPEDLKHFLKTCYQVSLPIQGLMGLPPQGVPSAPYFRNLRIMAHDNGLEYLSMGMSSDFEEAILEGSTHLRIGRALSQKRCC